MIRRTLALHFARASKRPAPVPKPLAASAAFIPPPPPPPPRTAAAPVNAASSRNVKASNSEFVDELTDNTGTGLAFGTVVVTLSALFGAHVVHSILKPDLTIPDMENEVFERKRKLKEAERNLTFGQASAR